MFQLDIEEESFAYQRHQERIDQEAALDGIYVIRTSVAPEQMDAQQNRGCLQGVVRRRAGLPQLQESST